MNTNRTIKSDEARPDVDFLLHNYFQSEMPHAWPAFKMPKPMRMKQPASSWSRYSGRLALAACVAILLAGYLTLGGFFPQQQTPTGLVPLHNISMKEKGTPMSHK